MEMYLHKLATNRMVNEGEEERLSTGNGVFETKSHHKTPENFGPFQ